jgi:hypothetical protein
MASTQLRTPLLQLAQAAAHVDGVCPHTEPTCAQIASHDGATLPELLPDPLPPDPLPPPLLLPLVPVPLPLLLLHASASHAEQEKPRAKSHRCFI